MSDSYLTINGQQIAYSEQAQSAVSGRPPGGQIRRFLIAESDDTYVLVLNAATLVGTYEQEASAVGALVGCYFGRGASSIFSIENSIGFLIDSGLGNIPSLEEEGDSE